MRKFCVAFGDRFPTPGTLDVNSSHPPLPCGPSCWKPGGISREGPTKEVPRKGQQTGSELAFLSFMLGSDRPLSRADTSCQDRLPFPLHGQKYPNSVCKIRSHFKLMCLLCLPISECSPGSSFGDEPRSTRRGVSSLTVTSAFYRRCNGDLSRSEDLVYPAFTDGLRNPELRRDFLLPLVTAASPWPLILKGKTYY